MWHTAAEGHPENKRLNPDCTNHRHRVIRNGTFEEIVVIDVRNLAGFVVSSANDKTIRRVWGLPDSNTGRKPFRHFYGFDTYRWHRSSKFRWLSRLVCDLKRFNPGGIRLLITRQGHSVLYRVGVADGPEMCRTPAVNFDYFERSSAEKSG